MLDFSNTEIAFSHKSDADLRNADCLFRAIKQPFIVKCGKGLAQLALGINFPVAWAVKPTLFKQFVGRNPERLYTLYGAAPKVQCKIYSGLFCRGRTK